VNRVQIFCIFFFFGGLHAAWASVQLNSGAKLLPDSGLDAQRSAITNRIAEPNSRFETDSNWGLFPVRPLPATRKIQVSGFYRFTGTYRVEELAYPRTPQALAPPPKQIFVGDDAQLPNLWLNVRGRPGGNLSWSFDLFAFQFLDGRHGSAYSGQVPNASRPNPFAPLGSPRLANQIGMNLGMNLGLSWSDRHVSHQLRLGGIHWYSLSDLTLASFRGYYRWSLFERNPWDPIGQDLSSRYEELYTSGQVNQDSRFGERAVHGAIWDMNPHNNRWKSSVFAGKTELNAGLSGISSGSMGGRIQWNPSPSGWGAFNTFHHFQALDTPGTNRSAYQVNTLEGRYTFPQWEARGEWGLGKYVDPAQKLGWAPMGHLKVLTKPSLTGIPIEVHAYHIDPKVVNNNGLFWNVSVREAMPPGSGETVTGGVGSNAVLRPFASAVLPIGLMTNNREGINLNTRWTLGQLRFNLGMGMAREIEAISNRITYNHPVNQFTRARFWRWTFPQQVGPYGRQSVMYRDVFETVTLSDDSAGIAINRKHFSTLEGQISWRSGAGARPLYVMYLTRLNSVQKTASALPQFASNAYLRQYSHELEAYKAVSRTALICAYAAYEWTLGNYATDLDLVTYKPRNQQGWALGVGCDINLGPRSALFFRHRLYGFRDFSFDLDQFRGRESLVELKVFF
jgi:hypothetical protein